MGRVVLDIKDLRGGRMYLFGREPRSWEARDFDLAEGALPGAGSLRAGNGRCWLSLPLYMLDFRVVELPFGDMERVREVLPFELDGIVAGQPRDFAIDAVSLGGEGNKTKVLAVYTEKGPLKSLLEGLAAAGLYPVAVTSIDLGLVTGGMPGEKDLPRLLTSTPEASEEQRAEAAYRETGRSTINLRRGELAYTGVVEKTMDRLRLAAAMLLAIALLVSGDFALRTHAARKDIKRLDAAIAKVYSGMLPDGGAAGAKGLAYRAGARISELRQKEAALRGVSPLDTLMEINGAAVSGVQVREVAIEGGNVVLGGEAPSLSEVQRFKSGLEAVLSGVDIQRTEQSASDRVVFSITAKEKAVE